MIEVRNLSRQRQPSAFVLRQARKALRLTKTSGNLEIVFVTPQTMRRLAKGLPKREYHGEVLSFSKGRDFVSAQKLLGEIFLCPQTIKKEAKKRKSDFLFALTANLIHGILHLAGYDHKKKRDWLRMTRREKNLLEKLFHGH